MKMDKTSNSLGSLLSVDCCLLGCDAMWSCSGLLEVTLLYSDISQRPLVMTDSTRSIDIQNTGKFMSVLQLVFVLFKVKIFPVQSLVSWLNEMDSTGATAGVKVLKKFDDTDTKMKANGQTEDHSLG
jgi:hypothetical protein